MFAFQFDQLNRQGELRHDESQLESFIEDPSAQFLPLYKQYIAASDTTLLWLNKQQLINQVGVISRLHCIYLGTIEQQHFFAYRLSSSKQLKQLSESSNNLRALLPKLSQQDAYLANVATALNQWHASHQHCGFCGTETYATDSGFVRQCSNTDCAKEHFPRTDPAIIVAITHKDHDVEESILLGRQSSWEPNRYSVIAGFVEPGESLEQAVKREAMEEVGIGINEVTYITSQPWPFPQSVMLGFTANAETTAIELKDKELETAAWFTKKQIIELQQEEKLLLPFPYSISRFLIERWLK